MRKLSQLAKAKLDMLAMGTTDYVPFAYGQFRKKYRELRLGTDYSPSRGDLFNKFLTGYDKSTRVRLNRYRTSESVISDMRAQEKYLRKIAKYKDFIENVIQAEREINRAWRNTPARIKFALIAFAAPMPGILKDRDTFLISFRMPVIDKNEQNKAKIEYSITDEGVKINVTFSDYLGTAQEFNLKMNDDFSDVPNRERFIEPFYKSRKEMICRRIKELENPTPSPYWTNLYLAIQRTASTRSIVSRRKRRDASRKQRRTRSPRAHRNT